MTMIAMRGLSLLFFASAHLFSSPHPLPENNSVLLLHLPLTPSKQPSRVLYLWSIAGIERVDVMVMRRRLCWLGHLEHLDGTRLPKCLLVCCPLGSKLSVGGQKMRWYDVIMRELKKCNLVSDTHTHTHSPFLSFSCLVRPRDLTISGEQGDCIAGTGSIPRAFVNSQGTFAFEPLVTCHVLLLHVAPALVCSAHRYTCVSRVLTHS